MINKKITELSAITTISDNDVLSIVDISESETKKVSYTQLTGGATKTEIGYLSGTNSNVQAQLNAKANDAYLKTGWYLLSATLAYSSADAPTFVATTSIDLTSTISVGMKLKLTQTTVKYFIVTAITATTITLYGGTDYTLINAAISNVYFSNVKAPFGFPMNPDKWCISFSETNLRVGTPTNNTWWNPNTKSLSLPIGSWEIYYSVGARGHTTVSAGGFLEISAALSTSSSSATLTNFIAGFGADYPTAGLYTVTNQLNVCENYTVTTKTLLYLLHKINTGGTIGATNGFNGAILPTAIKATCAYL